MGLAAAALGACLYHCLYLYRDAGCRRARSNCSTRWVWLALRGLLVPQCAIAWGGGGHAYSGALPLCLSLGSSGLSATVDLCARGQPHPWLQCLAKLCQSGPAFGPSGHHRRPLASLDGELGRLRHGSILRRLDLYHRDLPDLVWSRRTRRGRSALRPVTALCIDAHCSRTGLAETRPLPSYQSPLPSPARLSAARLAGHSGLQCLFSAVTARFPVTYRAIASLDTLDRRPGAGSAICLAGAAQRLPGLKRRFAGIDAGFGDGLWKTSVRPALGKPGSAFRGPGLCVTRNGDRCRGHAALGLD